MEIIVFYCALYALCIIYALHILKVPTYLYCTLLSRAQSRKPFKLKVMLLSLEIMQIVYYYTTL